MTQHIPELLARAKSANSWTSPLEAIDNLIEAVGALHAQRSVGTGTVPPIGEYWSGQGGVNAGLMRGGYYLLVPTDPAAALEVEWGSCGETEPGAQDEYDGAANTRALVASAHSHPAAEACASLMIDGYHDLYLPARRELALCFANVPELFKPRWHWSSTQSSADYAWVQAFVDGYQGTNYKSTEFAVRAVRRFSPSSI